MILLPTGLFAATRLGHEVDDQPGAHGFSNCSTNSVRVGQQRLGIRGPRQHLRLQRSRGQSVAAGPLARTWDIATGMVMLISRFVPIIAPVALAGSLALKKPTPFTVGTLRTDT